MCLVKSGIGVENGATITHNINILIFKYSPQLETIVSVFGKNVVVSIEIIGVITVLVIWFMQSCNSHWKQCKKYWDRWKRIELTMQQKLHEPDYQSEHPQELD